MKPSNNGKREKKNEVWWCYWLTFQIVVGYASQDAVLIQGRTCVLGHVARAVWGASVSHLVPLEIGNSVELATLAWPPMATRLSALRQPNLKISLSFLLHSLCTVLLCGNQYVCTSLALLLDYYKCFSLEGVFWFVCLHDYCDGSCRLSTFVLINIKRVITISIS